MNDHHEKRVSERLIWGREEMIERSKGEQITHEELDAWLRENGLTSDDLYGEISQTLRTIVTTERNRRLT